MTDLAVREQGSLALLAELERNGAISTIGLHLSDPNLPFGRFEALCTLLGKMNQAVKFAIGDAIILGEKLYGERAYQAFEALGMSEEGMREHVRVSSRVPMSRRKLAPSWSHARAVATLPPVEQREWLKTASEQGMSHHALREALRPVSEPSEGGSCTCCGRPL